MVAVVAYGKVLPPGDFGVAALRLITSTPRCCEVPRGRPIQWALLNGEIENGVTIMKSTPVSIPVTFSTGGHGHFFSDGQRADAHQRLAGLGAKLLVKHP